MNIKQQQHICNVDVYKTSDSRKPDKSDLEFKTEIDWEQRRFELVKTAMQSIIYHDYNKKEINAEEVADDAIYYADAVITKLKEK